MGYPYFVAKLSRRFLFFLCLFVVIVCQAQLIFAELLQVDAESNIFFASFVFILVSVCSVTGELARSVYFIIVPELIPYDYRIRAKSFTIFLKDSVSTISSCTFYLGLQTFGLSFLLTFIVPQLVFFVFLFAKMPETKGKRIDEIMKSVGIQANDYETIN